MAEPEISHRCAACGAAIRTRSQFCPQCGKPLKKGASDALLSGGASEMQPVADREMKTTPLVPPTQTVLEPAPDAQPSSTGAPESQPAASEAADGNHGRQGVSYQEEKPAKSKRVKNAAREMVQENVRPRVEKLRKASNVVFEEAAAIDPSLRFILIAVLIFIIFVTLLLLSFIK